MSNFINLARHKEPDGSVDPLVDSTIELELLAAGIYTIKLAGPQFKYTEVPYSMVGVLTHDDEDFREFQDYAARHGDEKLVNTLHEHMEFVFVRCWRYWSVRGYVPLTVAKEIYANPVGKKSVRAGCHASGPEPETQVKRMYVAGLDVVTNYHIDDQEGLKLFADTVKKHNLIKGGM